MAEEMGHKNEVISDADEKLGQIADMIRDACTKFDSLASRMDAVEEAHRRMDAEAKEMAEDDDDEEEKRADARRKDGAGDKSFKEWAEEEGEEEAHRKDSKRKDARRKDDDDDDLEVETPGEPEETAADRGRKDDDEKEEGDRRVADSTKAQLAALRAEIAALNRRTPAILNDLERERFSAIQEQAEPAFQAFGDRAPAPLDGESPTQYKRRLGSKLQANSPKWAKSKLSAVSDDTMLDTILADVYADSIAAARKGADVAPGQLREISRQVGGHIINEFVGEPASWMGGFTGRVSRAR